MLDMNILFNEIKYSFYKLINDTDISNEIKVATTEALNQLTAEDKKVITTAEIKELTANRCYGGILNLLIYIKSNMSFLEDFIIKNSNFSYKYNSLIKILEKSKNGEYLKDLFKKCYSEIEEVKNINLIFLNN